ncbi:hypothetical protein BJI67_07570 [Acidihalobacter aeolianus]|uniref:Uncharacterized protein n=1 Tax=Acidihalobacter aeolianus TaxID=2792603 RepID=A0A1D8K7J8_9GAMM|nr:DUF58 domain-containing protein [Acidihalobacter aeolianus]AOV16943.1 hypothetical protein BJI67_07570 [Acidihalobacter aeolianus]
MDAGTGRVTLNRLRGAAKRRGPIARWAYRRLKIDGNIVVLHRRRLFILPSGAGFAFGAMLAVMLLFALNYNNSMIFGVTFLLAGIAINAIWQTHRNLLGLRIELQPTPVLFAGLGGAAVLDVRTPGEARPDIVFEITPTGLSRQIAVDTGTDVEVRLDLPVMGRGVHAMPKIHVSTRYPLGIFRAWTLLHFPQNLIVAPAPVARDWSRPPGSGGETPNDVLARAGEDEHLFGLRPYQHGDALHRIAWRASARSDSLVSKQFVVGSDRETLWLRWEDLPAMDTEARLSLLCRRVLDADADGQEYALSLPDRVVPPGQGPLQRRRCLDALARFEGGGQ